MNNSKKRSKFVIFDMVSLNQHLQRIRSVFCTKFLFAVLVSSIGSGFQHGYHTGVLNIPTNTLQEWIIKVTKMRSGEPPDSTYLMIIWSTIVASFSLGGIFGGCLTNFFAEKLGRRNGILWSNLLALLAIVLLVYSKPKYSLELLILGRFVAGINAGLNSGLCQIYLVEISPDKIRGFVAGFYQLTVATSILIAQVVGVLLGDAKNWPFLFLVPFIPICFQLFLFPLCPESPKYLLINKGNKEAAEEALMWFNGKTNFKRGITQMQEEIDLIKNLNEATLKKILCDISLRSRLAVSLVLNIGQQLCGINAIIYFSNEMFTNMGLSQKFANNATIALGTVNVLVTLIGIVMLDYIGRRIILLIGFLGMAINTLMLTIVLNLGKLAIMEYISTVLIFSFIILFALGVGIVPWFLTGEIFNHTPRSLAVSLVVSSNWLFNYLVAQTFLPLQSVIGNYAFIFFVAFDCIFYFFTVLHLPETARRSPKEIFEIYYE